MGDIAGQQHYTIVLSLAQIWRVFVLYAVVYACVGGCHVCCRNGIRQGAMSKEFPGHVLCLYIWRKHWAFLWIGKLFGIGRAIA